MRLTAENWRDTQRPDGFLPYGFDFLADRATDVTTSGGYVVRQAGAFYVWANYYELSGDDRYRESLRRGIAALGQRSLTVGKSRAQEWLEATHVLSLPAGRWKLASALSKLNLLYRPTGPGKIVSADGQYTGAWTHATALALLAELTYSRVSGDESFSELRKAWLEGLLAVRIPGRGFREHPTSIDEADYANGEAWLALAAYADRFRGDDRIRRVLADIDRSLMDRYSERPSNEFYSWGAMAAAQRWKTTSDPRFLLYLRQQAQIFVPRFEHQYIEGANRCSAMEGLAATLGVLEHSSHREDESVLRIRAYLSRGLSTLSDLQIQPGQSQMTFGGTATLTAPHLAQFAGAFMFDRFDPTTRVDAASHCLSALMLVGERFRFDTDPGGVTSSKR